MEERCCLCNGPLIGFGNNPDPVCPPTKGCCCDKCNKEIVIPARRKGWGIFPYNKEEKE